MLNANNRLYSKSKSSTSIKHNRNRNSRIRPVLENHQPNNIGDLEGTLERYNESFSYANNDITTQHEIDESHAQSVSNRSNSSTRSRRSTQSNRSSRSNTLNRSRGRHRGRSRERADDPSDISGILNPNFTFSTKATACFPIR